MNLENVDAAIKIYCRACINIITKLTETSTQSNVLCNLHMGNFSPDPACQCLRLSMIEQVVRQRSDGGGLSMAPLSRLSSCSPATRKIDIRTEEGQTCEILGA